MPGRIKNYPDKWVASEQGHSIYRDLSEKEGVIGSYYGHVEDWRQASDLRRGGGIILYARSEDDARAAIRNYLKRLDEEETRYNNRGRGMTMAYKEYGEEVFERESIRERRGKKTRKKNPADIKKLKNFLSR